MSEINSEAFNRPVLNTRESLDTKPAEPPAEPPVKEIPDGVLPRRTGNED